MPWEPWLVTEQRTLARYANPLAVMLLPTALLGAPSATDLRVQPDGKRATLQLVYERLLAAEITYALEPFNYTEGTQEIRQPTVILGPPHDATCLDLAVLVAGLALYYELLPLIVVLEGHALVAVSRMQYRREAEQASRPELRLFEQGLLPRERGDKLHELVARGEYLALECTGIAWSSALSEQLPEGRGRVDGRMDFERACAAGTQQLAVGERRFLYALDVHELQRILPPYPIAGTAALDDATQQTLNTLPQRIDDVQRALVTPRSGSRVAEVKRKALQRRLDARIEEYDAVMQQIEATIDAQMAVRLGRSATVLAAEMEQLERDVRALG